jgi:Flp pilus assembly protein TadG
MRKTGDTEMKSTLKRLLKDESGTFAVIFAVALVPLVAFAGSAVDYSNTKSIQSDLQAALDSAVLAAVSFPAREKKLGVDPLAVAAKTFTANYPRSGITPQFRMDGAIVRGTVSTSVPTWGLKLVGITNLTANAVSAATANPQRLPVCFMAWHAHRKHTLELKDTVSVYAPDCNFYGNSDDVDDVVDPHNPQNFLTGKTVQAIGFGHHYLQNVTPPLQYAPDYVPDPLAGMAMPTMGTCTATNKVVANQTVTLSPGAYCGGLKINGNSTVTLNPGTYFINNGTFSIANSTVTGNGVTIVINGTSTPIDWSSSTIRLAAPTSGSLAGIVVTGERKAGDGTFHNATVDLHGVVYLPYTAFTWTNNGTPTITAKWTTWIIDGVTWKGNGVININWKPSTSPIPFPGTLNNVLPIPGPAYARLVH